MAQQSKAPGLGSRAPAVTVVFRAENTVPARQNPGPRQALPLLVWAAIHSAILREHAALPVDHPLRRPTVADYPTAARTPQRARHFFFHHQLPKTTTPRTRLHG